MPKIPRFDQRVGVNFDPNTAISQNSLYSAQPVEQAQTNTGEKLQGISKQMAQLVQKNEERKATDYVVKKSAELQVVIGQNFDEAKRQALANGSVENFTKNADQFYDKTLEDSLKDAPNGIADALMRKRMGENKLQFLNNAVRFEADARTNIYKQNLSSAIDNYAKSAALDPSQLPGILLQVSGNYEAARNTLGLAEADNLMKDSRSHIVSTAIASSINENPYEAEELLEMYRVELNPKNYLALKQQTKKQFRYLENQQYRNVEYTTNLNKIQSALTGNGALDPTSSEDRQAIEDAYKAYIAETQGDGDFSETAIKLGMMSKQFKKDLEASLFSSSPKHQKKAAFQISKILNERPVLTQKFSRKALSFANSATKLIQAGIDEDKALQQAYDRIVNVDNEALKQRRKEFNYSPISYQDLDLTPGSLSTWWNNWLSPSSIIDRISNEGPIEIDRDLIIPTEMKKEANELVRNIFETTELDRADVVEQAGSMIKSSWTISTVGGFQRYMRNAPELFYSNPYFGTRWMNNQLVDELSDFENSNVGDVKNKKLILQAANLKTEPPVYNVFFINEDDGSINQAMDNKTGKIFVWRPDLLSSKEYQKTMSEFGSYEDYVEHMNRLNEIRQMQYTTLARGM